MESPPKKIRVKSVVFETVHECNKLPETRDHRFWKIWHDHVFLRRVAKYDTNGSQGGNNFEVEESAAYQSLRGQTFLLIV